MAQISLKKASPIVVVVDDPETRDRDVLVDISAALRDVDGVSYVLEGHNGSQLRFNAFLVPGLNEDQRKSVATGLRAAAQGVFDAIEDED